MSRLTRSVTGLEAIIELLEMRFEYDTDGRIVRCTHEGVMPRFVLGRSAEGCVWRFAADLDAELVRRVSRLASREPGFPIDLPAPHPPPERLVMIERLLVEVGRNDPAPVSLDTSVERIERDGATLGEIWTLE